MYRVNTKNIYDIKEKCAVPKGCCNNCATQQLKLGEPDLGDPGGPVIQRNHIYMWRGQQSYPSKMTPIAISWNPNIHNYGIYTLSVHIRSQTTPLIKSHLEIIIIFKPI